jgi:hypothetical protein
MREMLDAAVGWTLVAAYTFVVGLWLAALIFIAQAHDHGDGSWINNQKLIDPVTGQWCCNLHDCREEPGNVSPVDGGYLIHSTGEVIPRERVIWRSPGGWWRCRHLGGPNVGKTRCLIGPPMGS